MYNKEKLVKLRKSLKVITLSIATTVAAVGDARANDGSRYIVVLEPQPLEHILESELQTARFAQQIATLNGIEAASTVVPKGTTIRVPESFLLGHESGSVVFAKGDVVHAQKRLIVNPPTKGSPVYIGDIFTTGTDGFVSLSFGSGSTVNVQPDSRVAVKDIQCADEETSCVISLNAEAGEIDSSVVPRAEGLPPVDFTVTTPFLSAAVRGTSFYVQVDKEANRLGVTEGMVATESNGAANDLPKGKGLMARDGIAPGVVDLLSAPVLLTAEGTVIYSSEDSIRWRALQDAESYRLAIARDAGMTEPVLATTLSDNSALLPENITPGEYQLSVAGVNDFPGLPATSQFFYASIDDEEELELRIEQQDGDIQISPLQYDGAVEILIRNDLNNPTVLRRFVGDFSNGLSLQLDPAQDWMIQARKRFSNTSVSVYSYLYFLEANE